MLPSVAYAGGEGVPHPPLKKNSLRGSTGLEKNLGRDFDQKPITGLPFKKFCVRHWLPCFYILDLDRQFQPELVKVGGMCEM